MNGDELHSVFVFHLPYFGRFYGRTGAVLGVDTGHCAEAGSESKNHRTIGESFSLVGDLVETTSVKQSRLR